MNNLESKKEVEEELPYVILLADNVRVLTELTTEYVNKGYVPIGGATMINSGWGQQILSQTVYKPLPGTSVSSLWPKIQPIGQPLTDELQEKGLVTTNASTNKQQTESTIATESTIKGTIRTPIGKSNPTGRKG